VVSSSEAIVDAGASGGVPDVSAAQPKVATSLWTVVAKSNPLAKTDSQGFYKAPGSGCKLSNLIAEGKLGNMLTQTLMSGNSPKDEKRALILQERLSHGKHELVLQHHEGHLPHCHTASCEYSQLAGPRTNTRRP
jgi:hypothetical protein